MQISRIRLSDGLHERACTGLRCRRVCDLRADALILTAQGTQAATAELRVLDQQAGQAGAPDRITIGFRPPRLAPGEYHLLVTLTGPAGATQTRAAEFTVPAGGGG